MVRRVVDLLNNRKDVSRKVVELLNKVVRMSFC